MEPMKPNDTEKSKPEQMKDKAKDTAKEIAAKLSPWVEKFGEFAKKAAIKTGELTKEAAVKTWAFSKEHAPFVKQKVMETVHDIQEKLKKKTEPKDQDKNQP